MRYKVYLWTEKWADLCFVHIRHVIFSTYFKVHNIQQHKYVLRTFLGAGNLTHIWQLGLLQLNMFQPLSIVVWALVH